MPDFMLRNASTWRGVALNIAAGFAIGSAAASFISREAIACNRLCNDRIKKRLILTKRLEAVT